MFSVHLSRTLQRSAKRVHEVAPLCFVNENVENALSHNLSFGLYFCSTLCDIIQTVLTPRLHDAFVVSIEIDAAAKLFPRRVNTLSA